MPACCAHMARRPLLSSTTSRFAFCSGVIFLVVPKGSYRSKGTGCGMPSACAHVRNNGVSVECEHAARGVEH